MTEPKTSYQKSEYKGIIRVAGKDLKGELILWRALYEIKGIGINIAKAMAEIAAQEMGFDKDERIGNLTSEQVTKLEDIITNPEKHGMPSWMLNRKRDPVTGKDGHLVMADLDFQNKKDIELMKNIKSYRGIRHMFGLTCRGQRTKTSGRHGGTLGVTKKKEMPKTAPEKGKGGGKEKKK